MRNVYVVGAYIPNGGTFMAYNVGLILSEYIHGELIAIRVANESAESSVFEYPLKISMVGIDEFRAMGTSGDVLIMNPSFSDLWLGPGFHGYKLMYVQHFNTFNLIDRWFDSYVSVSDVVRDFLNCVYGLDTPIIPPFVDLTTASVVRPWTERPKDRVLVITKGSAKLQVLIFERIKQRIARNRSDVTFDFVPGEMKHKEFLTLLGGYRYVLSLSCAEGFGLVPLESMGLGAAVIAFDAGGGTSYMVEKENCLCTSYPNVERLADHLLFALNNQDLALEIARKGALKARTFTYDRFRNSWLSYLQTCHRLK
jgi:glycosyltransferase involved in cell wall biosynthesis